MPITISGSTGIAGVDGSASTPAVQGTDTNTGIAFPAADTVAVATGGTERMRVGSNGSVGIGTSSPNKSGSTLALTVNTALGQYGAYELSTNDVGRWYINADATNVYDTAMNNTNRTFYTGGSERMRIDSSGNVGIGTSSPGHKLQVNGAIVSTDGTTTARVIVSGGVGLVSTITNHPLAFQTNDTERARITSGGDFLIGTSSTFDNVSFNKAQVSGGLSTFINTTGSTTQISFFNPNGRVGFIGTSGTSTSYNTSSDYRLKENVVPLAGASARVAALKPYRFNFIGDPAHTVDGFLAHEAAEVVPEAINGEKDAVDADGKPIYQGIDQSKLVPLLTAALQEALTEIASLKARLTALEAK